MAAFRFGLRARMIVLFIVFSGAVSALLAVTFSQILRDQLVDSLRSRLLSTVVLGADTLDKAALGRLVASVGGAVTEDQAAALEASPEFHQLSDQLGRIRSTDPEVIRFVYTFVPTADPQRALYAVDADVLGLRARQAAGEAVDPETLSSIGSDLDLSGYSVARRVVAAKKAEVETEFVHDPVYRVNSVSGYAPVLGADGTLLAVLGVDMVDTDVQNSLAQVTWISTLVTAVGLALSLGLSILLGALLTRNLLSLRKTVETFGTGDLSVRAPMRSRDEVGDLAASFNRMADTIVEDQQRISQAERQRAEAELLTQVEAARNAENRKYLDHVAQGLLLMDSRRNIGSQYSRALTKLFRLTESPTGLDFLDLVYPDAEASAAERKELLFFLSLVTENPNAEPDMLDSVNPMKGRELTARDGSTIVVDARFVRVSDAEDGASLMVVFEDLTLLADLERLRSDDQERHRAELEAVASLLRHGPQLAAEFLAEGRITLDSLAREDWAGLAQAQRQEDFRRVHSLKSTARALELHRIADEAHRLEDLLAAPHDPLGIEASRFLLDEALAAVQATVDRLGSFASAPALSPREDLEDFSKSLAALTADLAETLGKPAVFRAQLGVDAVPSLTLLKDPLRHLVRNALDHGIEEVYERLASGKPTPAQVILDVRRHEGRLVLTLRDDGRGVDFAAVKRAAVVKGWMDEDDEATESQLLSLLFRPGFSSRPQVSDTSGRGVGLDAVVAAVKKAGGQVRVRSKAGVGTSFILSFPA